MAQLYCASWNETCNKALLGGFPRYFNSENVSEPQFQFSGRPAGGSKNPIWRHMIITTIFNIDLEGHGCRVRFEE